MSEDFIKLYDNFLNPDLCDYLVQNYKTVVEQKAEEVKAKSLCQGCTQCHCTRVDLMQFPEFNDIKNSIVEKFENQIDVYKKDCNIQEHQFPKIHGYENLKIKRYLPNSPDQFKPHVDVDGYANAKRFLVFIVYLNDDFEGGETTIINYDKEIKPKKGTLLMFPPLWTHWHQGKPVLGGDAKYILGSYLHYL